MMPLTRQIRFAPGHGAPRPTLAPVSMTGAARRPQLPPVRVAGSPSPARLRPVRMRGSYIAQAAGNSLAVSVAVDGVPAQGVPVNVLFGDGSSVAGVTGPDGMYIAPFTAGQVGLAFVKITQPEGTKDIGLNQTQEVTLTNAPKDVVFELQSSGVVAGAGLSGLAVILILAGVGVGSAYFAGAFDY